MCVLPLMCVLSLICVCVADMCFVRCNTVCVMHTVIVLSLKCWMFRCLLFFFPVMFFCQSSVGSVTSPGTGAGIVQLVEHPTEKPGAILTWVWCGKTFFPKSTSCADCSVRTVSVCNCISAGSHAVVWTHENTAFTGRGG